MDLAAAIRFIEDAGNRGIVAAFQYPALLAAVREAQERAAGTWNPPSVS